MRPSLAWVERISTTVEGFRNFLVFIPVTLTWIGLGKAGAVYATCSVPASASAQTALEQINLNVQFREMAQFFEKIYYLHLVPQLIRNRAELGNGSTSVRTPSGSLFVPSIPAPFELLMVVVCPSAARKYSVIERKLLPGLGISEVCRS